MPLQRQLLKNLIKYPLIPPTRLSVCVDIWAIYLTRNMHESCFVVSSCPSFLLATHAMTRPALPRSYVYENWHSISTSYQWDMKRNTREVGRYSRHYRKSKCKENFISLAPKEPAVYAMSQSTIEFQKVFEPFKELLLRAAQKLQNSCGDWALSWILELFSSIFLNHVKVLTWACTLASVRDRLWTIKFQL